MKIFSIKEIVQATNDIFNLENNKIKKDKLSKKKLNRKLKIKINH